MSKLDAARRKEIDELQTEIKKMIAWIDESDARSGRLLSPPEKQEETP